MAAVRALPMDLLRALRDAELCDPGILLACPRGDAESLGLAPQSSERRIVGKSQDAQSRPDPTLIDGMYAAGIDAGTGGIVSYPIVSIASYPVGGSVPPSLPVPGSAPVVPLSEESVSQGSKNFKPKIGQMTAQRCKEADPTLKLLPSDDQKSAQRCESGKSLEEPPPYDGQETAQRSDASDSALLPMHGQKDARELPKKVKGVKKEQFPRSSRKAKNTREGRQSASQPADFSPRVDAPISATRGRS